jgi:uncharacterized protein YggE
MNMLRDVFVGSLFIATLVSGVLAQDGDRDHNVKRDSERTVRVRGEGKILVAPDQVRLSVQVIARGETAVAAMKDANARTAAILAVAKSLGVETKNMQTSRVSVTPIVDYTRQIQPPPILGYNGNNDFSILFQGSLMEKVGEFIDRATSLGASSFGSLMYESSRQREIEREALQKAAGDAQARAMLLAKELGAVLGKVHTIAESISSPSPVFNNARLDAMSASSASAPVMTGEITIRASVDVSFELK